MSSAVNQEPGIIRDEKWTWILGIGIALLIVLIFWGAGSYNRRVGQPWSPAAGPNGSAQTGANPAGGP
jgi:hypothetical protein